MDYVEIGYISLDRRAKTTKSLGWGGQMKGMFPEHRQPTSEEFSELWRECVFVFDNNVLLNVIRSSPETSEKILVALRHYKDRIWIPYQVSLEFFRSHRTIIIGSTAVYDQLQKHFDASCSDLSAKLAKTIDEWSSHPTLVSDSADTIVKKLHEAFTKSINMMRDRHPTESSLYDRIRKLEDICDGKVGRELIFEESLKKEGEYRKKQSIPPGYKDEGFGDYIIWKEIIGHATSERKSVIFISNDVKEDWYLKVKGKIVGPRPELRREFREKSGHTYYSYSLSNFLKRAQEDGVDISEGAIEESLRIENQQRKMQVSLTPEVGNMLLRLAKDVIPHAKISPPRSYANEHIGGSGATLSSGNLHIATYHHSPDSLFPGQMHGIESNVWTVIDQNSFDHTFREMVRYVESRGLLVQNQ